MDFIDLFERVVREAKPDFEKFIRPTGLDVDLSEQSTGLDSLDMAMIVTYLGEIYAVPEEVLDGAREIRTVRDLKDFLEANGKRIPQTLEEAEGYLE